MLTQNDQRIAQAIISKINSLGQPVQYRTVGITDDPKRRHEEHGKPVTFTYWQASSGEAARILEKYFLDQGCKGGPGGGSSMSFYIYVY